MKVNDLIKRSAREAAHEVVAELERKNKIKDNRLGSFKKTEKILYEYPSLKNKDDATSKKRVQLINVALERVRNDPYFDLIELKYFKHWTHERIAEYYDVDVSVISKRRTKLVNQLRPVICSDDFFRELNDM